MLSGEGMQRRKKVKNNNIGLISNSNFARAAQYFCTFLCLCFARLQLETSRNFLVTRFMEEMSHVFPFTAAHFHLALVAASISHFVTAGIKFSCCPSTKNMSPLFFYPSGSKSLSPFFLFELRWPAVHFLFFSVFLLLYIPNLWT